MGVLSFFRKGKEMPPEEAPESRWAREINELKDKKDYSALAGIYTWEFSLARNKEQLFKKSRAHTILREVSAEAVDVIIEEAKRAQQYRLTGVDDLAELLCDIGDPKAVPMLGKMLDAGRFTHWPMLEREVRDFVNTHLELAGKPQTVYCFLCGKAQPITETEYCFDHKRREYRLCKWPCWPNRREWLAKLEKRSKGNDGL